MSRILRLGNSKMTDCSGPSNAFPLKLRCVRSVSWRMLAGIWPERLRLERSRAVIRAVLLSHLTPDHEHQTLVEEGDWVQSLKVLRGSLKEDFRERSEMSWRGRLPVVVAAVVAERRWVSVRKKVERERWWFMVLRM